MHTVVLRVLPPATLTLISRLPLRQAATMQRTAQAPLSICYQAQLADLLLIAIAGLSAVVDLALETFRTQPGPMLQSA